MSNKTWLIILLAALILNIACHICIRATELNYYSTMFCAFAAGMYLADAMGEKIGKRN